MNPGTVADHPPDPWTLRRGRPRSEVVHLVAQYMADTIAWPVAVFVVHPDHVEMIRKSLQEEEILDVDVLGSEIVPRGEIHFIRVADMVEVARAVCRLLNLSGGAPRGNRR